MKKIRKFLAAGPGTGHGIDTVMYEADTLRVGGKRAGDDIAPPAKKKKAEIPRPRWVESQHIPVVMHGGGPFQGGSGYRQHFEVRGGPPRGFRGRSWRVRGGRRGGY